MGFVTSKIYFIWDLNYTDLMLHDVLQHEMTYLSDTSQFSVACYTSLKILDARIFKISSAITAN